MGVEGLYCSLLIKEGPHGVSLGEQDLTKDQEEETTKVHQVLTKDLVEDIIKDHQDLIKDQVGLIKDPMEEVTIKDLIKDQEVATIKDPEEDLTKDLEEDLIKVQEEGDIIREVEETSLLPLLILTLL